VILANIAILRKMEISDDPFSHRLQAAILIRVSVGPFDVRWNPLLHGS
jgi:hypothetical protein